jgi:hypothetical protein
MADGAAVEDEMRMLGSDIVLGRWSREALERCKPGAPAHLLKAAPDGALHFVLKRAAGQP